MALFFFIRPAGTGWSLLSLSFQLVSFLQKLERREKRGCLDVWMMWKEVKGEQKNYSNSHANVESKHRFICFQLDHQRKHNSNRSSNFPCSCGIEKKIELKKNENQLHLPPNWQSLPFFETKAKEEKEKSLVLTSLYFDSLSHN